MLITRNWALGLVLVWSFDPVPSSVTMTSETPGVEETTLVSGSTSEANHHASGTSGLTESSRVINSDLRRFSTTIELDPREWSLLNAEAPDIVDSFLSSVSTKDQ